MTGKQRTAEEEIGSEETQRNSVDSSLPQTGLEPQAVVQKYERERSGCNCSLEEEPRTAFDTVASKTEGIDRLRAEIERLRRDVTAIFQEKRYAQKALEEEEKLVVKMPNTKWEAVTEHDNAHRKSQSLTKELNEKQLRIKKAARRNEGRRREQTKTAG